MKPSSAPTSSPVTREPMASAIAFGEPFFACTFSSSVDITWANPSTFAWIQPGRSTISKGAVRAVPSGATSPVNSRTRGVERSAPARSSATTADTKMSGPVPAISAAEAAAVLAELRAGAERSTPLVREFTGLVAPEGTARTAPLLIVDRPGWIQANVDGFAQVISPLLEKVQEKKGSPNAMAEAIGSRVTGLEVGALLGFMSSKVLGQFDPFYAPAGSLEAGRMLLVAPNIVHAENELGVDTKDFRLWVCLHEETHRVQFTAVPWMRDNIHDEIAKLVGSVEVDPLDPLT